MTIRQAVAATIASPAYQALKARLPIYTVKADRATGQWLGTPEDTGRVTTRQEWTAMQDTDAVHYDTYEHPVDSTTTETRAIEVRFVD